MEAMILKMEFPEFVELYVALDRVGKTSVFKKTANRAAEQVGRFIDECADLTDKKAVALTNKQAELVLDALEKTAKNSGGVFEKEELADTLSDLRAQLYAVQNQ